MKAEKEPILRLLKTARGQIDGIIKMVEEDRYCIDISNQLLATQSILKKTNKEIIHAHITHCVKDAFDQGDPQERVEKVDEVMQVLEKMMK